MTTLEAYNLIKNRVEWKGSLNTDFNFLTPLVPESGRYLQEEHTSVRIPIIYETIVSVDIENADFETELEDIKKRAILQMLHDVFYDRKDIKENWIIENPSLFDYAIILKNTIAVLSDILNSSRINNTTLVSADNLKRWFVDLKGMNNKENGVYVMSYGSIYKREINSIRKVLFTTNKKLISITTG